MKPLLLLLIFLFASSSFAQYVIPPNVALPSPNGSSMSWIGAGTDTTGKTHLLIEARTPDFTKAGHFVSTDGGKTWSGSDTIPSALYGNNPWGAIDENKGYAYDSYNFNNVARSTDWGSTWDTAHYTFYSGFGDAPSIIVDNGKYSAYESRVYVCGTYYFVYSTNYGVSFDTVFNTVLFGGLSV